MTFDEHVQQHRNSDGTYDLAAAEQARADELEQEPGEMARLAKKAAQQERSTWEKSETANLRKQFAQPALSPALELEVKVPLGDGIAVELGDMNHDRIRVREDLRTDHHLHEIRAYDAEMTFWQQTRRLLPPDTTVREAI